MNRRDALRLFGSMPVIGPKLASKVKADLSASKIAGMSISGLGQGNYYSPPIPDPATANFRNLAMKLPWVQDEIRKLLLEHHRNVYSLDPDLAVLKAISLSAKICIQRQRNIERSLKQYTIGDTWSRLSLLFSKAKAFLG